MSVASNIQEFFGQYENARIGNGQLDFAMHGNWFAATIQDIPIYLATTATCFERCLAEKRKIGNICTIGPHTNKPHVRRGNGGNAGAMHDDKSDVVSWNWDTVNILRAHTHWLTLLDTE